MKPETLFIRERKQLSLVNNLIRDGEFSDGDFTHDGSVRVAALSLWKPDEELSSFQRTWIFGGWRIVPLRRLELRFNGITEARFIKRSAAQGNHPLEGVHWKNRGSVLVDTYNGLTIELLSGRLDGQLEVTNDVDTNRVKRYRSFRMQRGD